MEQMTINQIVFKSKELEKAVNIILDLGFKIYTSHPIRDRNYIGWFLYTNGKDWAYIQKNYNGIDGLTVYKPTNTYNSCSYEDLFRDKTEFSKNDFVELLQTCNTNCSMHGYIPFDFERDAVFKEDYFELVS